MTIACRVQRLAFCLPFLVSEDDELARSAYGEFSVAPYEAVKALTPHLDRELLKSWINSEQRTSAQRCLLFTLLGLCGTADDVPFVVIVTRCCVASPAKK